MKSIALAIALAASTTAFAKAPPDYTYSDASSVSVSVTQHPRVLIFSSERFGITADGVPVVCVRPNEVSYRDPACVDAAGKNAWYSLQDSRILPGWKADRYEIKRSYNFNAIVIYFKQ